jgi:predicted acyl esterase
MKHGMRGGNHSPPISRKSRCPMLNCISFASQMMHTRGSARVYEQAGSAHKWLYTHRGGEWTAYYSSEVNCV